LEPGRLAGYVASKDICDSRFALNHFRCQWAEVGIGWADQQREGLPELREQVVLKVLVLSTQVTNHQQ